MIWLCLVIIKILPTQTSMGREEYAEGNGGRIKPLLNYCGKRVLPH